MDLRHFVDKDKHSGVIALSDVHAELHLVTAAVDFATKHGLFIVFLGDYIDGGVLPHETVSFVKKQLDDGIAVAIIGNHEDKFYRHAIGHSVILGKDQLATLSHIADEGSFYADLRGIVEHRATSHYFHYSDTVFIHGAAHHSVWTLPEKLTSKSKAMALYGEVDGTRDEVGFPVRTYAWVDAIPTDHTVVAGHDRTALGKTTTEAVIRKGALGGTAIFTDTSCGKIDAGYLTGAIFNFVDDGLEFSSFVPFRT